MDKETAQLGRELTGHLLNMSTILEPEDFQVFIGATIANVVGNLDEGYWQLMKACAAKPCDIPGCTCHVAASKVMDAYQLLRDDHTKLMKSRGPMN